MSTLVSATPAGLGTIARRRPTTATSAVRRNRRKIGKRTRWPDRHRRSMASPPRNRKRKPATAKPPPTVNTEEALLYYFFFFLFPLKFPLHLVSCYLSMFSIGFHLCITYTFSPSHRWGIGQQSCELAHNGTCSDSCRQSRLAMHSYSGRIVQVYIWTGVFPLLPEAPNVI